MTLATGDGGRRLMTQEQEAPEAKLLPLASRGAQQAPPPTAQGASNPGPASPHLQVHLYAPSTKVGVVDNVVMGKGSPLGSACRPLIRYR